MDSFLAFSFILEEKKYKKVCVKAHFDFFTIRWIYIEKDMKENLIPVFGNNNHVPHDEITGMIL